jgi:hypothetical protein
MADAIEVLGNGRFALMLMCRLILGLMVAGGWLDMLGVTTDYVSALSGVAGIQVPLGPNFVSGTLPQKPPGIVNLCAWVTPPFLVYLLVLSLFWAVYNQIFLTLPALRSGFRGYIRRRRALLHALSPDAFAQLPCAG